MRKISGLSGAALAFFSMPAAASAQMVISQNPASIVKAMQKAGYRAELAEDDSGDPMIRSASSGSNFQVLFYGCTEHKACGRIQFAVSYLEPKNASLSELNAWNAKNYFGRAYLSDKGAARLEMDLDLDDGGMSPALFEDNLEWWVVVMSNFAKQVAQD